MFGQPVVPAAPAGKGFALDDPVPLQGNWVAKITEQELDQALWAGHAAGTTASDVPIADLRLILSY